MREVQYGSAIFLQGASEHETREMLRVLPDPRPDQPLLPEFLSCMHLAAPPDPAIRQGFLASVFGATAEFYDQLIDIDRNLANIRNLLTRLSSTLGPACHILDVGCGPGLTKRIASEFSQIRITALDACPTMRYLAAAQGMHTISPSQLRGRYAPRFDGAFAAYLMDVEPSLDTIEEALHAVRPGGQFIANFHKGRGLPRFLEWANGTGYLVREIPQGHPHLKHGPVWTLEVPQ